MADDSTRGISRRKFIAASGTVGALTLAGCTQQNDPSGDNGSGGNGSGNGTDGGSDGKLSGNIDIAGSSTVFPLAQALKESFTKKHPDVKIAVSSTGSGGGFQNYFCVGKTDFNNASRPIQKSEKQLCKENGVDWHEIKVATDAVTVIVNPEADWIDSITVDELKQIWKPNGADKWSDVNPDWPDEPLNLFGAAETSGTFDYFTEVIVGEEGKSRKDYSKTEKDNQIIQGVASDKYAMGYLGFAYYSENKERVKALAIDNGSGEPVKPSIETAKSGKYKPLARPLFTYPKIESLKEEHIAAFARYWVEQSTSKELVAERVGYVPNSEEEMKEQLKQLNEAIQQ
ncbi:PstS family phosphate ABC transporter substrate-binding protein [Halomarina pelagica]|uniref:PstS family phosphate ABC transporter substrate-binding protein n=1 Tax=Halomarina pelagica TaxID=2961599 RepID=UPI0020C1C4AC|nr:PstS family phosphate ABC transporter substrate-binding protein [Halomarina sp. BND7]